MQPGGSVQAFSRLASFGCLGKEKAEASQVMVHFPVSKLLAISCLFISVYEQFFPVSPDLI